MFSYGMVVYELLTGRRPALGNHQLQTAKKLTKGIRPVLGSPEQVQFYNLHMLMTECWDTKPEKVRRSLCSLRQGAFCLQTMLVHLIHSCGCLQVLVVRVDLIRWWDSVLIITLSTLSTVSTLSTLYKAVHCGC